MSTTLPSKLGRYEVLEEIGKGAMGVVYLARDPLIGRLVALKTFRVGFAAKDEELAQFRSRFVREAQSAGILSHPNIVTIHDVVDEGPNGVCFIAMEYVKGTNLKQLLQRPEPFTNQFVVEVIAQIAEGLDYAHSRGVVHRDIKPANILINADNRVKITDFGIARLDTSNLTMEGQLLGTPNYMAPEQIQGKDIDHRADIFSLGVVFYEMLTRRKPFQGENLTQVTHKIVYEPFAPPEEIVHDLPPGLSTVLTRCLQKDPNRRYPRAAEVARELRSVLEQAEELEDTSTTQEVEAGGTVASPEAIPTRRLERSELAGAAAGAPAAASAATPTVSPEQADLAPTRRLERAEVASASAPPPPPAAARVEPSPTAGRSAADKPPPGTAPTAAAPAKPAAAPAQPAAPSAAGSAPAATKPSTATSPAAASAARKPAPRASRKTLWIAFAGAAALVLVVAGVFLAMQGSSEPPKPAVPVAPVPSPEQQNRITAATALAEARAKFAEGDLNTALQAVARAELADPNSLEVKLLREAIETRTREEASEAERQKQVGEGLAAAREASQQHQWDDTIAAARGVLTLEPDQEEARKLLAEAQRNQRKDREREDAARAAAAQAAATPQPSPATAPAPAPAAPVAKDAALRVDFASDRSEGVLTIYAGERQILREPFRFVRKTGFLRTEKISGRLDAQRRLPTGPVTLRVYVAMPDLPTKAIVVEGAIDGGRSYQLQIRVDADGRATAELH
jgi:serine/threonine protein kinase